MTRLAASSPVYFDPSLTARFTAQLEPDRLDKLVPLGHTQIAQQELNEPLVQALIERHRLLEQAGGLLRPYAKPSRKSFGVGANGFIVGRGKVASSKAVAKNRRQVRAAVRGVAAAVPDRIGIVRHGPSSLDYWKKDYLQDVSCDVDTRWVYDQSVPELYPEFDRDGDPLAPYEPSLLTAVRAQNKRLADLGARKRTQEAQERAAAALLCYVYPENAALKQVMQAFKPDAVFKTGYRLDFSDDNKRRFALTSSGLYTLTIPPYKHVKLEEGETLAAFCRGIDTALARHLPDRGYAGVRNDYHGFKNEREFNVRRSDLPKEIPSIEFSDGLVKETLQRVEQLRREGDEAVHCAARFNDHLHAIEADAFVKSVRDELHARSVKQQAICAVKMGVSVDTSAHELVLTARGFAASRAGKVRFSKSFDPVLNKNESRQDVQKAVQARLDSIADDIAPHLVWCEQQRPWWKFWG